MKIKISVYQMASAIIMVSLGSSVLFLITPDAKQDAWISMLIYILPGVVMQLVYVHLWKKYPDSTPIEYMPKIFGNILGYSLSIIYIVFFAYEAARVLRDITELILISSMPRISIYIIIFLLTLISSYYAYLGLECMCRLTNIFFYLWIIFFALEWLFLFTTPDAIKFYNLRPILQQGMIATIKISWKLMLFPYGETILFTMFLPLIKEVSKVKKYSVLSIILVGIILSLNTIMFIAVLGPDLASNGLFPFLRTIRLMRIGQTFDRLDVFVILILMIGGVIKISFFMYGSMLGSAKLLKLKDIKYLTVPFGIAIFFASIFIAKNYPQHIYIGQMITLTYIHIPLVVFIPILALFVYYTRKFTGTLKK